LRFILTFKSTIEDDAHPKGYSIAKILYEELIKSDVDTDIPDNYRDIAWSVDCNFNSKKVFFFVGFLGTKITDWQLILCSGTGFFRRLFGYNDNEECLMIAKLIHGVLSNNKRISDIKWFTKYTDSLNDAWYSEPTQKFFEK
jgi:hypothetical protein